MNPLVDDNHPLCGTWHCNHEDGEDYRYAEYSIQVKNGEFLVSGIDRGDNEKFVISNVDWNGEWLTFSSLMPSTKRYGNNKMRFVDTNEIEFQFTYTVHEVWRRKLIA